MIGQLVKLCSAMVISETKWCWKQDAGCIMFLKVLLKIYDIYLSIFFLLVECLMAENNFFMRKTAPHIAAEDTQPLNWTCKQLASQE